MRSTVDMFHVFVQPAIKSPI